MRGRDVYPVKYYRKEGFVERKIELDEENLAEMIKDYLLRHADFEIDEVEVVNNRPMSGCTRSAANMWPTSRRRRRTRLRSKSRATMTITQQAGKRPLPNDPRRKHSFVRHIFYTACMSQKRSGIVNQPCH